MATGFAPLSFFTLAQQLRSASSKDDAELRSAISRAYYAAFLVARDAKGMSSRGVSGHAAVIDTFMTGNGADIAIGNRLSTLKKLREKADYETRSCCTGKDGANALLTAQKILMDLNALPQSPPNPPAASPPGSTPAPGAPPPP